MAASSIISPLLTPSPSPITPLPPLHTHGALRFPLGTCTLHSTSETSTLAPGSTHLRASISFCAPDLISSGPDAVGSFGSTANLKKKLRLADKRGHYVSNLNVQARDTATVTDTERENRISGAAKPKTLYDVLGVSPGALDKDIKKSYRQLARRHHPDVVTPELREESTATFLQIHAAYVTLSDPRGRARYDLQLSFQGLQLAGYDGTSAHSTSNSNYYPRSSFASQGRGRNWETDQCW